MTEEGDIPQKRSKLREDVEAALKEAGISLERKITLINLDNGEEHYFDDYPEAMEFTKGKKGRWYMATPGIRYIQEKDIEHKH